MNTTITTTNTTTNNTPTTTDPTVQAMITQAVNAALAANKGPQKTEAELKAENAANAIKNNLGGRVMRDLENDASVRVGLRTAMSQSLIAGGALGALGYTDESAKLLAQGEAARFAQRKGLRAEGATGTLRAGLSYVPFVGDLFLGGDSVQERALYAQQNAAAAQQNAMNAVAGMVAPVAEQIKQFLAAGTMAAQAQAMESGAKAMQSRVKLASDKAQVQGLVRGAADKLAAAAATLGSAKATESAALAEIAKLKLASAPKAQVTQAEKDHQDTVANVAIAEREHMIATVEHGEIMAVLLACG